MGLVQDIEKYREPRTRMVGLEPNPPDHSTDNGLLFSATYLKLLERLEGNMGVEYGWFLALVESCELEYGLVGRYPGAPGLEAHDDLIGIAAVNRALASDILGYGEKHFYSWNTEQPGHWSARTFLYRIGGFIPFLRVRSRNRPLSWLDKLNAAVTYFLNTFEKREETSGKCLLFLMSHAFEERGGWLVRHAVAHWRKRMLALYPDGLQEMYSIYFPPGHPFRTYAPSDFA